MYADLVVVCDAEGCRFKQNVSDSHEGQDVAQDHEAKHPFHLCRMVPRKEVENA